MRRRELKKGWTFQRANVDPGYYQPQLPPNPVFEATVPGCVTRDLVRHGVIQDPFFARGEIGAQWVGEADWEYRVEFDWQPFGERHKILRFECLDTVATVTLNGILLGAHDNYFLPVEFDVSQALVEGRNVLRVLLESPIRVGMERRAAWIAKEGLPHNVVYLDERAFVRKPGYAFGWDWGPRLVGAGIPEKVELLEYDHRLVDLDIQIEHIEGDLFRVTATATTVGSGSVKFEFVASCDCASVEVEAQTAHSVSWLVDACRWNPRGYGAQTLHTIRATLGDQQVSKKIGLKTVRLLREPDQFGESFAFEVNGKRIWARGANWIPNQIPLPTAESLRPQLERYASLNFNMLRVWGGGVYECEEFYDLCDELGILVWQDFPYACMYYPDDDAWQASARREAEFQVRRLGHRASLALWCGNNENLVMWQQSWGSDRGSAPPRYLGERIYEDVLPEVVATLNPQTPYIPSSPIGRPADVPLGGSIHDGMDGYGDSHYWDVWHGRGDWVHYRESTSRFSSEFGFASACSLDAWASCLHSGAELGSHEHLHHDKTGKPWTTFLGYVAKHYPDPNSLEDWTYFSQLNQRDALRCGIEHYRKGEFCKGTLIWQANDCWPVQSWAVEDFERYLKPAGWELRRLYAPLMIVVDYVVCAERVEVWVVNDDLRTQAGELEVHLLDTLTAETVEAATRTFTLEPGKPSCVWSDSLVVERSRTVLRVAVKDQPDSVTWRFLAEPRDMRLADPAIEWSWAGGLLTAQLEGFAAEVTPLSAEGASPLNCEMGRTHSGANEILCWRFPSRPESLLWRRLGMDRASRTAL